MWPFNRYSHVLMSCGSARELMLNAPKIKWHLKHINKQIQRRAKNGYSTLQYMIDSEERMLVDDIKQAIEQKGYIIKISDSYLTTSLDISWDIQEDKSHD